MRTHCRVCKRPVKPWRRGWRRPTTTIHEACLTSQCLFCGATFEVRKERVGKFCCDKHQWDYQRRQSADPYADAWDHRA